MAPLTWPAALLLLGLGCRTPQAEPAVGVPTPAATAAAPADAAAGGDAPAPLPASPGDLYAQCRDRVEGPEADGECSADADCGTGGCSQEICAPVAALDGIMSTCETLPCFQVLESCGCHEGRCTWTVAAPSAADLPPPIVLPPKDQLTGEPEAAEPAEH